MPQVSSRGEIGLSNGTVDSERVGEMPSAQQEEGNHEGAVRKVNGTTGPFADRSVLGWDVWTWELRKQTPFQLSLPRGPRPGKS